MDNRPRKCASEHTRRKLAIYTRWLFDNYSKSFLLVTKKQRHFPTGLCSLLFFKQSCLILEGLPLKLSPMEFCNSPEHHQKGNAHGFYRRIHSCYRSFSLLPIRARAASLVNSKWATVPLAVLYNELCQRESNAWKYRPTCWLQCSDKMECSDHLCKKQASGNRTGVSHHVTTGSPV